MISDLSDATAEQLLHAAEDSVREARALEIRKLELLLAWADLHSGDPQAEPDAVPVRLGGPRLITLGGDGTPEVQDLALVEMAIARHEGITSTRNTLADAFDLRHRLPEVWAGAKAGRCEPWVVRKVARWSRNLTRAQVRVVDTAVAAALDEAPSRILKIAEAKIVEAAPLAHAERIEANRKAKGVWYPQPRPGTQVESVDNTAGIAVVFARIDEADALTHARMIDDLAVALAEHAPAPVDGGEPLSMDHWRAEAFAMLADPAAVLTFLQETEETDETGAMSPGAASPGTAPLGTASVDLVIHLAHDTTGNLGPLGRVEGRITGPRLLDQVRNLLARSVNVTITPVVDLHTGRSVNGYVSRQAGGRDSCSGKLGMAGCAAPVWTS